MKLIVVLWAAASSVVLAQAPAGWTPYPASVQYSTGTDRETNHSGSASAFVKSLPNEKPAIIGLMQAIKADRFRRKRVRLSGYVRTRSEEARTRLFLQVDGEQRVLGLDAMNERAVKGSSDWKRHEIVLDVPEKAVGIRYGLLMNGSGQAWIDDVKLEFVDTDVRITAPDNGVGGAKERSAEQQAEIIKLYSKQPSRPTNLDFES